MSILIVRATLWVAWFVLSLLLVRAGFEMGERGVSRRRVAVVAILFAASAVARTLAGM